MAPRRIARLHVGAGEKRESDRAINAGRCLPTLRARLTFPHALAGIRRVVEPLDDGFRLPVLRARGDGKGDPVSATGAGF
jgi:hypothetical protein